MDRSSLAKWLLIGVALLLFFQFGMPLITGKSGGPELQPFTFDDQSAPAPDKRAEEAFCNLESTRFSAKLSSRGGSLRSVTMHDPKYVKSIDPPNPTPIELVTTSKESRMPLRTDFRSPSEGDQQVAFNDFDWKLAASDARSCTFTYVEGGAALEKRVALTDRPFELAVDVKVKNISDAPKKHRFAIEQSSWRTEKETQGSLGTVSEFLTQSVLQTSKGHHRLTAAEFEPGDFKDKEFTPEQWWRGEGEGRFAAAGSSYFALAVVHTGAGDAPVAEGQVEEYWERNRFPQKSNDPNYGHVFRARLAYPERTLEPQAEAQYGVLAYVGPKEREVLATVGGGERDRYKMRELIELGWFGSIGNILIGYVYWLYGLVKSWGVAIILLTLTVKIVVFPLSITQIRGSVGMRRIKPQLDAINEKYKDNFTERGLATQELMRREKVASPIIGCLPVLLQMPVWISLFSSLQTAVELYHTPFGPLIPDLSAPGKYFVIPLVLGVSSFFQQKIVMATMPTGDPAQQKMLLYMMPVVFTAMNIFLPAGIGVYWMTNTFLSIGQQLLVERWVQAKLKSTSGASSSGASGGKGDGIVVREKPAKNKEDSEATAAETSVSAKSVPQLGKGKARART
jgi:YidC/Oxa1 family membrane protein insertase